MSGLDKIREKLDALDEQLIELLKARAELALEVKQVKHASQVETYSPAREQQIIERARERAAGSPLPADAIEAIMRSVISSTRSLVGDVVVSYFGAAGSLCHQAALKQFGTQVRFSSARSIEEVFEELERGKVTCGVVPIETTTESLIASTFDMLMQSKLTIIAEIEIANAFALGGSDRAQLSNVQTVFGDLEALAKCSVWLTSNAPQATTILAKDASDAIKQSLSLSDGAALVPEYLIPTSDLCVLAKSTSDEIGQSDRLFVIGKTTPPPTGNDKTSVACSVKERSGALLDILRPLAQAQLTLTKIQSKSMRTRAWDYVFYLEFLGHRDDKQVAKVLTQLAKDTSYLKILGSYPAVRVM